MKTDDIFEALTDIDDKYIDRAYPIIPDPLAPVEVFPAERTKPRRKTLIAAAACAACVTAWGAVGVNYLHEKGFFTSSPAASNPTVDCDVNYNYCYWYPEAAKYVVSEKIASASTRFTYGYVTDTGFGDESFYAKDFDELSAQSDIIVAGEFIDRTHQTQNPEDFVEVGLNGYIATMEDGIIGEIETPQAAADGSFNYLKVEAVIKGSANLGDLTGSVKKGNVNVGDYLLINQPTSINISAEKNLYQVYANDRLTPMFKGDRWIYFLKKNENGYYTPVNGPQGRYPMPDNDNFVMLSRKNEISYDEFGTYDNAAPARQEIYDRLKKMLSGSGQNVQKIDVPKEEKIEYEFLMEEFPEYTFKVSNYNVIVNIDPPTGLAISCTSFSAISAWRIEDLYLADLNADGKRELCATISVGNSGVTAVRVCDLENRVDYILKSDNAENVYALAEDSGRLMAVTKEYLPLYYSRLPEERSRVPLTLDMMKEVKPDLEEVPVSGFDENGERTFFVPEFTSTWFTVSKNFVNVRFNGGEYREEPLTPISGDEIQKLFLYDINGDDRREICAQVLVDGKVGIRVYDFMEQATYSLFGDKDQSEHRYELAGNTGGALFVVSCSIDTTGENITTDYSTEINMSMLTKDSVRPNIYDISSILDGALISLPEFSDLELSKDHNNVSLLYKKNGNEKVIIGGRGNTFWTYNLFLTDLNGDSKPEVCATMICLYDGDKAYNSYKRIEVYDIANDEKYVYSKPDYDVSLRLKDDALFVMVQGIITEDLSEYPLSLDDLTKE